MEVFIIDPAIRHNVEELQHKAQKALLESNGNIEKIEHYYELGLHRQTGLIQDVHENTDEWKMITIQVAHHKPHHFEIIESLDHQVFEMQDLDPLALNVFLKTLHTLDGLFYPSIQEDPILDMLHWIIDTEEEAKELPHFLLDAWNPVTREQAERLLLRHPVGTFFFRKDEYTELLERELNDYHGMHIRCFTLTYLEANNKISDKTILFQKGRWAFYQDDPNLLLTDYDSLNELVSTLKLNKPLVFN